MTIILMAMRYGGMILQLAITILIADRLPPADAGTYFQIFGLIATFMYLVGLGISDGILPTLAGHERGASARAALSHIKVASGFAVLTAAALPLAAVYAPLAVPTAILLGTLWLGVAGLSFFGSQALVTYGHTKTGAFFFYSSNNIFLSAVLLPYLWFAEKPTLSAALVIGTSTTSVSAIAALVTFAVLLRSGAEDAAPETDNATSFSLLQSLRPGLLIALTRVLQTGLIWMPVWAVGHFFGPAEAAPAAIASRIAAAAGSFASILKFPARRNLIVYARSGQTEQLRKIFKKITLAALAAATLFLCINLLLGERIASQLTNDPVYLAVPTYLTIFLSALFIDSLAGPGDEFIKLIGSPSYSVAALLAALTSSAAAAAVLAKYSPTLVSGCQLVSSCICTAAYLSYSRRLLAEPKLP